MTIATITQTSSINTKNNISDMKLRSVRRNLFGTTVDRVELQQAIEQMKRESNQQLQSYEIVSVIGVIDRNSDDQARRLKRLPRCLESDDETDDESHAPREISTDTDSGRDSQENVQTTTDDAPSSSVQPTTSSKKSEVTITQQVNKTKGQKQLTDYFPIIKRKRKNHR